MALDYIIGGLQLLSAGVNVLALSSFWISPGLRTTANRFVINLLIANVIACLALTPALWLHGGLKSRFHIDDHVTTIDGRISSPFTEFDQRLRSASTAHRHGNKVERDVSSERNSDAETFTIVQESFESMYIERDENGRVRKLSEKQLIDIQSGNENDEIEIVEEFGGTEPKMALKQNRAIEVEDAAAIAKHFKTSLPHFSHKVHTVFTENPLIFDCTRFWGFDLACALSKYTFLYHFPIVCIFSMQL